MQILVLAEHDNHTLMPTTLSCIAGAQQLGDDITLLVAGYQIDSLVAYCCTIANVNTVLAVDHVIYEHALAENVAPLLADVGKECQAILAGASTFGKNIMPRVAALLDVGQISDIIEIISPNTFVRPIYAGNALATVQSLDAIKVLTLRQSAFPAIATSGGCAQPVVISVDIDSVAGKQQSAFIKLDAPTTARPDLQSAQIVVSGGRGFQNSENFKLLDELADVLGAAIGATRAAVDAGYVPNEYQVGQTGKVVAPKLYIAIGLSGAIQHLAGMKDSQVIVAINKDSEAPIFQMADYALQGDLFEILPQFIQQLKVALST